jgi:hypothetical protein
VPYLSVSDFKYGLDHRRQRVAGVPGTLWDLQNAHLTRGGDIERAKLFYPLYQLPAGTFGMWQVLGQVYVFGSANLAASMPAGVLYQQLVAPGTPNMTRVWDVKLFNSKLYVIAEYDDGNLYHFYDSTRVTDWDSISDSNSSFVTLADYLAQKINTSTAVTAIASGQVITLTSATPGTAFTLSGSAVNGGLVNDQSCTTTVVVPNVAAVAETRATATITVTGGTASNGVNYIGQATINAVPLLVKAVNWINSNSSTAAALAVEINNNTATHGYQSLAVGAVVTITAAPGTGATPNLYATTVSVVGNVTASNTNMSGGVTAVAAVAQISQALLGGTFEQKDQFTITVNGTAYTATGRASGTGTSAFISLQRVYSTANTLFRWCQLNNPTNWTDASVDTGAGFINLANQSDSSDRLQAAAEYNGYCAIFSRLQIRLYTLSAAASQTTYYQTLDNTGIISPRGVAAYGNNDVFYPSDTGIRSLRARDVLNAAYVNDIGTAIDTLVTAYNKTITADQIYRGCSVIDPVDGRYWLAVGTRVWVLSYFPTSQVTAWSYYALGAQITDMMRVANRLYVRSGDVIYLYGGTTGDVYPAANQQIVTVELPFMTADLPATFKDIAGYDQAATNTWAVKFRVDPNDETKTVNVGNVTGTTMNLSDIDSPGRTSHIAVSLVCSMAGPATLSSLGIHFNPEDDTPLPQQQAKK